MYFDANQTMEALSATERHHQDHGRPVLPFLVGLVAGWLLRSNRRARSWDDGTSSSSGCYAERPGLILPGAFGISGSGGHNTRSAPG